MAKLNMKKVAPAGYMNEGQKAHPINPLQALRRSVLSCLLWESEFYCDGQEIAARIRELVKANKPEDVSALAIQARSKFKLRHVPLLLARELARTASGRIVGDTIAAVIQRADELAEFLSIYWQDGKDQSLSAQVKKGLARAFGKFSAYDLAKYNRDGDVKLRDVLFLSHARPKDDAQAEVWKQLIDGKLPAPDTWEVALSGGADKREAFERLMAEGKLGALAFLRNLRNMEQATVPKAAVKAYAQTVKVERVLPFRFIAAARAVPAWEDVVELAMMRCLDAQEPLSGHTVLLVDTSPSMAWKMSGKSDLNRKDAALGVAVLLASICPEIEIRAFSSQVAIVPPRKGFALAEAIDRAVPSNGTLLGHAIKSASGRYERIIVLTDEESQDAIVDPDAGTKAYMVNLASTQRGVGYGRWTHLDGFSEAVIAFIRESETVAS